MEHQGTQEPSTNSSRKTGAPLGPPLVSESEKANTLTSTEQGKASPSQKELKELKRLESLIGKVSHEIKSVIKSELEEVKTQSPQPESPKVVVHRVEQIIEKAKPVEPPQNLLAPEPMIEAEAAIDVEPELNQHPVIDSSPEETTEADELFALDDAEPDSNILGQPSTVNEASPQVEAPNPAQDEQKASSEEIAYLLQENNEPEAVQPAAVAGHWKRNLLLVSASAIILTAFAMGGIFLWLKTASVMELEMKMQSQLNLAKTIDQRFQAKLDSATEVLGQLPALKLQMANIEAENKQLAGIQTQIMTWQSSFTKEKEELQTYLARLSSAKTTEEKAALQKTAEKAFYRAETAIQNLKLLGRQIETLAELSQVTPLLQARLTGDRWRYDHGTRLDEATLTPCVHPDSGKLAPVFNTYKIAGLDGSLPTAINNLIDNQTLLLIPPGKMILGDEYGDGDKDERPLADPNLYMKSGITADQIKLTRPSVSQSSLTISISKPFYVGMTEVSNRNYTRFVRATGYPTPNHWQNGECADDELDYPVINVSWHDAQAYCQWAGTRLLTEAEWEYCAKSPDKGKSSGPYPWGRGRPTRALANFDESPPRQALTLEKWRFFLLKTDTGKAGRNSWGLRHLAGNAAEWCQDWYRKTWYTTLGYADTVGRCDPQGPTFGLGRVIRGGSWYTGQKSLRASARDFSSPTAKYTFLGFRCALNAEKVISIIK